MPSIQSDDQFKSALSQLSFDQQRRIGKLFVENVIDLSDSPRIRKAIDVLSDADASAADIDEAFKAAKSVAIETYILCGREADWLKQAGHFVASAAVACLTPEDQAAQCGDVAWSAATNARMARNCEAISHGQQFDNQEIARQHQVLETFLSTD